VTLGRSAFSVFDTCSGSLATQLTTGSGFRRRKPLPAVQPILPRTFFGLC